MALCLPDLQKKFFWGDFFLTMIIITPTALNTNPWTRERYQICHFRNEALPKFNQVDQEGEEKEKG